MWFPMPWRAVAAPQITISVMMVVAGCLIAGMGDLSFDMVGYACAFASCAMQAAYLLLVEFQVGDPQKLHTS